jgi:hypothetical protein
MPATVTEAERASFLRCRRQWDFQAGMRQNLEPQDRPTAPDLDRAIRDALAVYYFPGMWDWDRRVRLPLVGQEPGPGAGRTSPRRGQGPARPPRPLGAHRGPVRPGRRRSWPRLRAGRPRVRQHEPSGGGRSVPQQHCPACPYLAPYLALRAGTQPSLSEYRPRPPDSPREGRLGSRSWGLGRGAGPPKFRRGPAS